MPIGEYINVKGFVTQEKFINGKSLSELERILGFQAGRLNEGAVFYALKQLPMPEQFEFKGYTQVAEHHFTEQYGGSSFLNQDRNESKKDYDTRMLKVKNNIIKTVWAETGPERLIKVRAIKDHDSSLHDDTQYPPGSGVPQWKLIDYIRACAIAEIFDYPNGVFRPFD
jgi:hypothetical protein